MPRLIRTDRDGTVRLRVRGGRMRLETGRSGHDRAPRLDSPAVPAFRSAYLIHGDDHGRIAERRTRLRAMAEAESGAGGVELLEGDACTPEARARGAVRDDVRARAAAS